MTKLTSKNIIIKKDRSTLIKAIFKAHQNMLYRVNSSKHYANVSIEEHLLDRENWKQFCLDNGFFEGCSVSRRQDIGDYERCNITFTTKAQNKAGGFYWVEDLTTGDQHVVENLLGWCRDNNLERKHFEYALTSKKYITSDGLYRVQKFVHNYKQNHEGVNYYFTVDTLTGKKEIVNNLAQWCRDNHQDYKYLSSLHSKGKYFSKEGRYKVIKLAIKA